MWQRLFLWLLFLPLQTALALVFLISEFLHLLALPFVTRGVQTSSSHSDLCSIIVLNWNGRALLEESLPALVTAVAKTGKSHEILVVDNGSEDDSVAWVRSRYPEVNVLVLDRNYGFAEGNNKGVRAARHDLIVLLNNDMIVREDFLSPLLEPFADPSVFAVSSQVFFPRGKRREETGNTRGWLRWGYLNLSHDPVERYHYSRKCLPVLWAGGGSSAFDRSRFLALGGFSEIFSPCYFEDTDLSYRAWRRGWKVLFAPESKVLHKHRSTSSSRFASAQLSGLIEQRRLWYLWKNYPLGVLFAHFLWFPIHLSVKAGVRDYLGSLRRLPAVLKSRITEPRRHFGHSTVFGWIDHPLRYLDLFFPDRARSTREPQSPLRLLILSAYLPHLGYHGGAGRVLQLLMRVALKHDITLLSFVETPKEAEELVQVKQHCKRAEIVYRRGFQSISPFPYEPFEEFNSPDFREKLEKLLTEQDFDLVHYEWTQMALYADLLSNIPSLLTEIEVNYAAHQSEVRFETNPILRFKKAYDTLQTLYRELEMCRKVDKVICVTDVDRDFLRGYLPDRKLRVINTGVDTAYFKPGKAKDIEPNSIVFVGAFRHQPNVDAMLFFSREVFPLIQARVPDSTLYVVGSSPPDAILRLAANPGIRVTGFVRDIRTCYAQAQVVVVPIRTGVGIRGKILEGWAAGKAMVATPIACLGIRAVHGENIMMAEEPEKLALWTVALLENPDFCLRLGRAGRRTAEAYYDWSRLAKELVCEYESLTGFVPAASFEAEAVEQ